MAEYTKWATGKQARCRPAAMRKRMRKHLPRCRPLSEFRKRTRQRGRDRMGQHDYELAARPARKASDLHCDFPLKSGKLRRFEPSLLPFEVLAQGAFGGCYLNDCMDEFPREWWEPYLDSGRVSPGTPDPSLNRFEVDSGQPLAVWREKGWIYGGDPRGWFQWYCRYALGRRDPEVDPIQMRRWRAFSRHAAQIRNNCLGDLGARRVQRQALLHWAWPQPEEEE